LEDVVILYGHLVYFMVHMYINGIFLVRWYILWPFVILVYFWYVGTFCGHLLYSLVICNIFSRFGTYIVPRKIWHPCLPSFALENSSREKGDSFFIRAYAEAALDQGDQIG
jgi:hypothetical protein